MRQHYFGAIVIGNVVVVPHPTKHDHFILPGGRTANRLAAEAAAKRLNHWLAQQSSRN